MLEARCHFPALQSPKCRYDQSAAQNGKEIKAKPERIFFNTKSGQQKKGEARRRSQAVKVHKENEELHVDREYTGEPLCKGETGVFRETADVDY